MNIAVTAASWRLGRTIIEALGRNAPGETVVGLAHDQDRPFRLVPHTDRAVRSLTAHHDDAVAAEAATVVEPSQRTISCSPVIPRQRSHGVPSW